jgi:predicted DNA-binding protein
LEPEQKKRLARRAKLRGKSFSQEVRDAIDLYLDIPIESEEELSILAKEANRSADRMIRRLDETVAHVDRVLRQMRKKK